VRCIVHLAVPHFASWAGLTVVDGGRLRCVDSAGVDEFDEGQRTRKVADLEPAAASALRRATATAQRWLGPVGPDVVAAFAVPPGPAEGLATPGASLFTLPLPMAGSAAVLALATADEPDADELRGFAERAARALAAACAYEERGVLARTLRTSLLPAALPELPGLELAGAYRPAQESTEIGGDFYDVTPRPDGTWAISIGDVCGKGVEAAVLTGQVRQSLRTASLVTDDPGAALHLLNDTLLRADGSTFATTAYGILDARADGGRLRLASGGHPPPLLLRDGAVEVIGVRGTLVGILPEVFFETVEIELRPGDLLLFYTDGAVEARGPSGVLGAEPVVAALADSGGLAARAVTERLLQVVMEHLQGWSHDDIALLAIRCVDGAPS
jgi:serine phosphatase RsbU (regulator of sigma subunit)